MSNLKENSSEQKKLEMYEGDLNLTRISIVFCKQCAWVSFLRSWDGTSVYTGESILRRLPNRQEARHLLTCYDQISRSNLNHLCRKNFTKFGDISYEQLKYSIMFQLPSLSALWHILSLHPTAAWMWNVSAVPSPTPVSLVHQESGLETSALLLLYPVYLVPLHTYLQTVSLLYALLVCETEKTYKLAKAQKDWIKLWHTTFTGPRQASHN